jgi:hypothetical protein
VFFPSHQLSGYANGLSDIYHRVCTTIQQLQDDKTELQNRVVELEQHNPTAELRRLREENASLRAKLATAAKENAEITRERDVLLRKLNGIKQLVDGREVPQVYCPTSYPTPVFKIFCSLTKEPAPTATCTIPTRNRGHQQLAVPYAFRAAFMTYLHPRTPSSPPRLPHPRVQKSPSP